MSAGFRVPKFAGMKRTALLFLAAAFAVPTVFAAAPESEPKAPAAEAADRTARAHHLDDPAHLLPADRQWWASTGAKLAAFEREHGVKVLVRYHAKSPSEEEDKVPGAYMRALSTKLGTIDHGVLLVYFADDPDWRMWLSDDLTAKFAGQTGTAKELTASGAIHDAKETFFAAAKAKADAAFAAEQKAAPAGHPPAASRLLARHTDALLDGLFAKLGAE